MTIKFTKCPQNIPNGPTICRSNGHKIHPHLPLLGTPKSTQIGFENMTNATLPKFTDKI
jgi:hypothetical protein